MDELVLRIERRVAVRQHAVADAEDVGILAEQLVDFIVPPDVEGALHLVGFRIIDLLGRNAVGILRGIEAATFVRQIALHVGERVGGHVREEPIA